MDGPPAGPRAPHQHPILDVGAALADPEAALRALVSTCRSHFASLHHGSGAYSAERRLGYMASLASVFLDAYLSDVKAALDDPTAPTELPALPPALIAADHAACAAARAECTAAGVVVPWASLLLALTGRSDIPARLAITVRCALVAASCALGPSLIRQADHPIWSIPGDTSAIPAGTPVTAELLDARRDLYLHDVLAAASGSPFPRRLLPSVAAVTGRSLVVLFGRGTVACIHAVAIPVAPSSPAAWAPNTLMPTCFKPDPLHVSVIPWYSRASPAMSHTGVLDMLDAQAYVAQCTYPVVAVRAAAVMDVGSVARRMDRVRPRDGEEGEQEDGGGDVMMGMNGASGAGATAAGGPAADARPAKRTRRL
ncbi:hypothetical protein AMAG_04420 [Allomyces macrogynus ATCC 38327]|uniref:Uncharacterized protein n=1 Tax=Allomyces macrogynus (strain ATCC 38327) TaxID=578462 RepID=A0A0L0S8T0_ALLM3|nr:hypothetical protein AMAG_04420 [Allomyces macrogynus ATCC 38327]|eukprot:KNE58882.1 hypothetical protein AMAG_04420 [Allomyces macrogynus ATCC 38327]